MRYHPLARSRFAVTLRTFFFVAIVGLCSSGVVYGQSPLEEGQPAGHINTSSKLNDRLQTLKMSARENSLANSRSSSLLESEYLIGPEDLLEISVFEAPELNSTRRVTGQGEISLPLLGIITAASLTPRELELVLEALLRQSFLRDPHVGVFVREMQSHPITVFGAVEKPGIIQVRGVKSLIEVLSLAGGLADDAGDLVMVQRRGASRSRVSSHRPVPADGVTEQEKSFSIHKAEFQNDPSLNAQAETIKIRLKDLLEFGDPRNNVTVYPGDVVTVNRAGIVYVVGAVKKQGGFVLETNENISVLQVLAMAEGLSSTAAKGRSRIIRTDAGTGEREEIPIDLGAILDGKALDPVLQPKDILFVPNSAMRSGLIRAGETALSIVTGVIIWRR